MGKAIREKFELRIKGSNSGVTGTSYHLELVIPNGKPEEYLVDCGIFQEPEYQKFNGNFLYDPKKIKCVFLSHKHVDHYGQIPNLFEQGFTGKILTSIETSEYIKKNAMGCFYAQKRRSDGGSSYSEKATLDMLSNIVELACDTEYRISKHVKIRVFSNNHCRGALMFLIICEYKTERIYTLFTGDYKPGRLPIGLNEYKDVPITIITEGTYGIQEKPEPKFLKYLAEAVVEKKHLIIMATGDDRYESILNRIEDARDLGVIPEETIVFLETKKNALDIDVNRDRVITFSDARGRQDAIWEKFPSFIIVTTRGNVEYFMQKMVSNENVMIIFTNHVAEGSKVKNWILASKKSNVVVGKNEYRKLASIHKVRDFCGHAYAIEIARFLNNFTNIVGIFIGHGEKYSKRELVDVLAEKVDIKRNKLFTLKRGSSYKITKDEIKYYK